MHGRRIQMWREHRNLTQEQLETRVELSLSSIQRIEAGGEIRFSAIILVAEALGVPIGALLSVDPDGQPPGTGI